MKIIVSTHQGQLVNDEFDYIICKNENGEFAILKNHIPTVSVIGKGIVRLFLNKQVLFLAVENGILEFKNDIVTIVAQGAFIGRSEENVLNNLEKIKNQRLEANRKEQADFLTKEQDLINEIKKAKPGNL
jgi:F-type H+-transporting ATPase subunit epsilon